VTGPGWYVDPHVPGQLRWWAGSQWTHHVVRPAQPQGWYVDPSDPRSLRWWSGYGWTAYTMAIPPPPGRALDAAMEQMREHDPRPWGARPVVMPLGAYVVLIIIGSALSTFAPSHGGGLTAFAAVINAVIEAALAGSVFLAGREVARRNGGWGAAFGFRRPTGRDWLPALAGFGAAFGGRIAVGIVMVAIAGENATRQAQNLHVQHGTLATAILLIVLTVIIAPVVEELVFRGMILRTFMRRLSFWPAAAASTAIFALLHTYEVSTLVGAITLALSVGVIGVVNCVLVRRTNSLVPGMIVHAASNLLATVVLLLSLN
jgi:membrane protease YdiL (CAAX protease family)